MKIFAFAVCWLCIFSAVSAQHSLLPRSPRTGKFAYTGMVELPNPMADIWPALYEWMVKNSDADIVQIDHGLVTKLIGRTRIQVFESAGDYPAGHVNFTIAVAVKDGRYSFVFSDFKHTGQLLSQNRLFPDLGPLEDLCVSLGRISSFSARRTCVYMEEQVDTAVKLLIRDMNRTLTAEMNDLENDWQ